ncbi:MAG: hypothetical protein AAFQ85_06625 [Pseudomonadota bacterium]
MKKSKPIRVLWHGNVKANIWANPTQNGEMYSVNYARIYTDQHGKVQEAYTFTDVENLRLEALAREANGVCNQLRQEYNARSRSRAAPQAAGQSGDHRHEEPQLPYGGPQPPMTG